MLMTILNVVYVLLAIAMIALILMQRGSGAAAGAGFGGGASATVFGARGASSFLTKATKWLAITFFAISLYMAWHATHNARPQPAAVQQDMGVMGGMDVPTAPAGDVPAAPVAPTPAPANEVPSLPAEPAPAPAQ